MARLSFRLGFAVMTLLVVQLSAGAQTGVKESRAQKIDVQVTEQQNSPVLLALQSVDDTADSHTIVHYSEHNLAAKPIKATVLKLGSDRGGAGSVTAYHGSFAANTAHQSNFREERANRTRTISLSVDYVLFEDGTSWGEDSLKLSDRVRAFYTGKQAAVDEIRVLVNEGNESKLSEYFAALENSAGPTISTEVKTEEWKRSFRSGYRSTVLGFKRDFEHGGINGISRRLADGRLY